MQHLGYFVPVYSGTWTFNLCNNYEQAFLHINTLSSDVSPWNANFQIYHPGGACITQSINLTDHVFYPMSLVYGAYGGGSGFSLTYSHQNMTSRTDGFGMLYDALPINCAATETVRQTGPTTFVCVPWTSVATLTTTAASHPWGKVWNTTSSTWVNCPAGTYSFNGTSCATCPQGSYSTGQTSLCSSCWRGTYQNLTGRTDSSACKACPLGTEAPSDGVGTCPTCSTGTYGIGSQVFCLDCPKGTYTPSNGSLYCTHCAVGTYQVNARQNSCVSCPAGLTTYTTAASSTLECVCGAGTYPSGASCVACPNGLVKADAGNHTCCAAGFVGYNSTYCIPSLETKLASYGVNTNLPLSNNLVMHLDWSNTDQFNTDNTYRTVMNHVPAGSSMDINIEGSVPTVFIKNSSAGPVYFGSSVRDVRRFYVNTANRPTLFLDVVRNGTFSFFQRFDVVNGWSRFYNFGGLSFNRYVFIVSSFW